MTILTSDWKLGAHILLFNVLMFLMLKYSIMFCDFSSYSLKIKRSLLIYLSV